MCTTCGCSGTKIEHGHVETDAHGHTHPHGPHDHHDHPHEQRPVSSGMLVRIEEDVLAKNTGIARKNRAWFEAREVLALNLVSSPGAGKTTLLERTIRDLRGK